MDQVPIALQFYTSGGTELQVVGKTAGVDKSTVSVAALWDANSRLARQ